MNAMKLKKVMIGLIVFLIWFPGKTFGHTRFYFGFGTSTYYPSGSSWGSYPRHRCYNWPYRSSIYYRSWPYHSPHYYRCRPPIYHWPYRSSLPRTEVFIVGCDSWHSRWQPDYHIIDTPPVVIEKAPVIVKKETVVVRPNEYDKEVEEAFKCLRQKKDELLRKLKIGGKEDRKEVIGNLAGFSFDDRVRKALEEVLLSDPDPELRREVAKSFGKVKNNKALSVLEKVRVEDLDVEVRKEADKAIKEIKGC